ncbi:DUF386 domain-containing protein [Rhodobacteraceae bacterium RKSG542]|uniref:YhcH/YjgK/YiaL family protein n=1 Tax=Pseudovibrio flavus TaxID=2529854 RepID=UPI0012BC2C3D|nr:YhcH/YjgK/YiaL family protein [Pseudovibrio flavus]MTI16035.1 DUF386 domain-containing protein [Pseudovibrio flavus]
MLSANLDNLDIVPFAHPQLLEIIKDAKEFLATNPVAGRYERDGSKVFILVADAETEAFEKRRGEFHAKYLDVQILIEGAEVIGWGHKPVGEITENLLEANDVAFCTEIADEKFIALAPGDFAVFYPHELHRPLVAADSGAAKIRKAIVKIDRAVLA